MALVVIDAKVLRLQPGDPLAGTAEVEVDGKRCDGPVVTAGDGPYDVAVKLLGRCTLRELRVLQLTQLRLLQKQAARREGDKPCETCGVHVAREANEPAGV